MHARSDVKVRDHVNRMNVFAKDQMAEYLRLARMQAQNAIDKYEGATVKDKKELIGRGIQYWTDVRSAIDWLTWMLGPEYRKARE